MATIWSGCHQALEVSCTCGEPLRAIDYIVNALRGYMNRFLAGLRSLQQADEAISWLGMRNDR